MHTKRKWEKKMGNGIKEQSKRSKDKRQTSKKIFAFAFAFAQCEWALTPLLTVSFGDLSELVCVVIYPL